MKNIVYILLGFVIFLVQIDYLGAKDYRSIDSIMLSCPAQHSQSAESIAKYIKNTFDSESSRLRAAYSWVAQHICYDLSKMYSGIVYKYENEVVEQVLKTRKTICYGYAITFKTIAESLGIKIIIIKGYTKQNGKIDAIPHAWCAVKLNNEWKLIDPTWSSGYLSSDAFHKRFDDKWFLVHPDEIIKSHIPFDPVWQFSYFPINENEFSTGIRSDSVTSRFFSYPDTLNIIETLQEKDLLIAENRRIIDAGSDNNMISRHVENNKMRIKNIIHNENVNIYNEAVNLFNLSSSLYNENNWQAAKLKLDKASKMIENIHNPDKNMSGLIREFRKMINKLNFQIEKML
ncbi:MAG: hypothetical protein LBS55_13230 [Prevotellaceae bacterium]|jgi:transglutaminase/protease-like cytokinesis protein 3|nr:hypothetical protein [Prevotellaceae bacterium]